MSIYPSTLRSLLALSIALACTEALCAQDLGHGSLQANGQEPQLRMEGAAPGALAWIRIRDIDVAPAAPPLVYLLLSAERGALPLHGLGLPGAVLGLGPTGFFALGPLPIAAPGSLDLSFLVAPTWVGSTIYAQVLTVDPRLGAVPFALSDSRAMTFGSAERELVLVADRNATQQDVLRLFPNGSNGTPLPDLQSLVVLDIELMSIDEASTFRNDRARRETWNGLPTIRLADGGRILRYQRAGTTTLGLAHVFVDGRVSILVESNFFAPGHAAIDPAIVASSFGPFLAIALADTRPRLLLYRTDGANLSGSAEPLREITPANAFDLEPGAAIFGVQQLVFVDKTLGVYRFDLNGTNAAQLYVLPMTNGGAPREFDEEIAVSGDGLVFALGAGLTRRSKDVYVLRSNGSAINVTQSPADYSEVGYSNPGRRREMTLDFNGSSVSYVNNSTPEPEGFLQLINPSAVFHLTNSQTFVDSIDVGGIGQLPFFGGALVIAGLDEQSLDFYYTPSGQPQNLVNLTRTGTNPAQPPFGLGGQLALIDLGTMEQVPQVMATVFDRRVNRPTLITLDLQAGTSRTITDLIDGPIVTLGGSAAAVASGNDLVLARPSDSGPSYARRVALGAPAALLSAANSNTVFVAAQTTASARTLWQVDVATGTAQLLDPQLAVIDDLVAGRTAGAVLSLRHGALATTDMQGNTRVSNQRGLRSILTRD